MEKFFFILFISYRIHDVEESTEKFREETSNESLGVNFETVDEMTTIGVLRNSLLPIPQDETTTDESTTSIESTTSSEPIIENRCSIAYDNTATKCVISCSNIHNDDLLDEIIVAYNGVSFDLLNHFISSNVIALS